MAQISDDAAFCIYQLMLGGIDETQPMRLAALTGVDAWLLTRDRLGAIFATMQRRYAGISFDDLQLTFSRTPHGSATLPKTAARLICDHCDRICRVVPCPTCTPLGKSPKWATRVERSAPTNPTNHHPAVPRSEVSYNGERARGQSNF